MKVYCIERHFSNNAGYAEDDITSIVTVAIATEKENAVKWINEQPVGEGWVDGCPPEEDEEWWEYFQKTEKPICFRYRESRYWTETEYFTIKEMETI